jgi:hypothetical protein
MNYGTDQLIDATMARARHADACPDHALVAWVVLWDLPAYPETSGGVRLRIKQRHYIELNVEFGNLRTRRQIIAPFQPKLCRCMAWNRGVGGSLISRRILSLTVSLSSSY